MIDPAEEEDVQSPDPTLSPVRQGSFFLSLSHHGKLWDDATARRHQLGGRPVALPLGLRLDPYWRHLLQPGHGVHRAGAKALYPWVMQLQR